MAAAVVAGILTGMGARTEVEGPPAGAAAESGSEAGGLEERLRALSLIQDRQSSEGDLGGAAPGCRRSGCCVQPE